MNSEIHSEGFETLKKDIQTKNEDRKELLYSLIEQQKFIYEDDLARLVDFSLSMVRSLLLELVTEESIKILTIRQSRRSRKIITLNN